MTQYTDSLRSGINLVANRVVEMKTEDVDIVATWFFKNVNITPTFKEMYAGAKDSFLKKCSRNNIPMEFVIPVTDIDKALYWAELLDVEENGSDAEKTVLLYLQDAKSNEHIKKKQARIQAERDANEKAFNELKAKEEAEEAEALKAQQVADDQVSTTHQLNDISASEQAVEAAKTPTDK